MMAVSAEDIYIAATALAPFYQAGQVTVNPYAEFKEGVYPGLPVPEGGEMLSNGIHVSPEFAAPRRTAPLAPRQQWESKQLAEDRIRRQRNAVDEFIKGRPDIRHDRRAMQQLYAQLAEDEQNIMAGQRPLPTDLTLGYAEQDDPVFKLTATREAAKLDSNYRPGDEYGIQLQPNGAIDRSSYDKRQQSRFQERDKIFETFSKEYEQAATLAQTELSTGLISKRQYDFRLDGIEERKSKLIAQLYGPGGQYADLIPKSNRRAQESVSAAAPVEPVPFSSDQQLGNLIMSGQLKAGDLVRDAATGHVGRVKGPPFEGAAQGRQVIQERQERPTKRPSFKPQQKPSPDSVEQSRQMIFKTLLDPDQRVKQVVEEAFAPSGAAKVGQAASSALGDVGNFLQTAAEIVGESPETARQIGQQIREKAVVPAVKATYSAISDFVGGVAGKQPSSKEVVGILNRVLPTLTREQGRQFLIETAKRLKTKETDIEPLVEKIMRNYRGFSDDGGQ